MVVRTEEAIVHGLTGARRRREGKEGKCERWDQFWQLTGPKNRQRHTTRGDVGAAVCKGCTPTVSRPAAASNANPTPPGGALRMTRSVEERRKEGGGWGEEAIAAAGQTFQTASTPLRFYTHALAPTPHHPSRAPRGRARGFCRTARVRRGAGPTTAEPHARQRAAMRPRAFASDDLGACGSVQR